MNENLKRAMELGFTKEEILDRLLGTQIKTTNVPNVDVSPLIGQICICRTRSAGLHVGKVLSINVISGGHAHISLDGSHRLWSWTIDGAGVGVHGIANHGLKDGKVEATSQRVELFEVCEAVVCGDNAWAKIQKRAK